jgi:BirA family biotin operon repressor/biotin-[acetyl-CoA-carboxylase] ligase
MDGDRARSALADTRFAQLEWVGETGSTNADLLARARSGAPTGTVLVADHQTAGRGRLGRTWQAPPRASLLVSVLLRPETPADRLHVLTMAMGVSALRACSEVAGVLPALKWPNDLVVDGDDGSFRKLGGMLAESLAEGGSVSAVVIGLGLNVSWPTELPPDLAAIATSLDRQTARRVDREDLLTALLVAFDRQLDALERPDGADELLGEYREVCSTLGRTVRVDVGGPILEGEAVDVTPSGSLVVDVDGHEREILAGDVVQLR